MLSVYSPEFAWAYGERAASLGKVGKYHMAINTGMNRIGVHYTEVVDFRRSVDFHAGLQCDGTFTHFATADEPDGWDHQLQCKRFSEAVACLRDAGFDPGIVHCDNTPGSILNPAMHFDIYPGGIGLYGLQPCERTRAVLPLEPVMSIKARVTHTCHPAMGEGVGYGFTYRVPRTRVEICTLPIGMRRLAARALQSHGGPVQRPPYAAGGQYLHGSVYGGDQRESHAPGPRGGGRRFDDHRRARGRCPHHP